MGSGLLLVLIFFLLQYYTSKSGVEAANWIKTQFETFAAGNKDVTVELFEHKWAQPSVIATIKGNYHKSCF